MPMKWDSENDRLLLLKLIETHGISVDSNKIAAAWPNNGPKPTARAITERFVKLRQLAGIKVSITPGGASGRRKAAVSKYATPKKRKNKESSDESDADEHLTENESPTKKQSVQRFSGGRGGGSAVRGGRAGMQHGSSPAVQIKSEYSLSELPADPLDTVDTFQRDAAEAAELRRTTQQNPFVGPTSGGMNGGMNGGLNGGFLGFDASNAHRGLNGFGASNGTTFTNGFTMDDPFTAVSHPNHGIQNDLPVFTNGMQAATGVSVSRNRSTRTASAHASEGVAAVLRHQKDMDKADGEKSSGEDSQASQYYDADNDYI